MTHSAKALGSNVNELLPLVDDIPPVHRKADRPRGSRTTCTPTGPTTHSRIARSWRRGGVNTTWRGVGQNTAVAWGSIAGWRSGPCSGCTAFAGSGCGPIQRLRSMMPSSHWLQLSYVCGSYDKVFLLWRSYVAVLARQRASVAVFPLVLLASSFHEKLYNRGSAHTTLLALGAPPRH